MLGVVGKHRRIQRPVLVELRWKLDEIARDVGAGERGVLDVGEHPVQPMAELVEHRRHIVIRQQRGLSRRGLGEVGDIVNDRLVSRQR